MGTKRFLGALAISASAVLLATNQPAYSQAQPAHPVAAHRVRAHRVQTHRQNVGGAVQGHRQNVAGAVQTHRQNVGGAVQTHRQNVATARRTLPAYQPATITGTGSIVLPTMPVYEAPVVSIGTPTINPGAAAPAAPPAQPATPSVSSGSPPPSAAPATPAPTPRPDAQADAAPLDSEPEPDSFEGSASYEVLRVEDGGATVVLRMGDAESRIRLIGVATVNLGDSVQRSIRADRKLPSTEGYLTNLLKGERVYVVYDTQVAEQDADGKCVAYLYRAPDGLAINQETIRAGFAVTDTNYDFDQKSAFVAYQEASRKAGRGIYGMVQKLKARRGAASGDES